MAAHNELSTSLFSVESVLATADHPPKSWKAKLQKLYNGFIWLNLILCFTNMAVSFFGYIHNEPFRAILIGCLAVSIYILGGLYCQFVAQRKVYEDFIKWCEEWHTKEFQNVAIKTELDGCYVKSCKQFRRVTFLLPAATMTCGILETVGLSIWKGEGVSVHPSHSFWTAEDDWIMSYVNACICLFASFILVTTMFIFFGVVFTVIEYFLSLLKGIQIMLQAVEPSMKQAEFAETIRVAVELHCQLIERQQMLQDLTEWPLLSFEICSYSMAGVTWVVVLLDPDQILTAIGAGNMWMVYFVVCWMNERLVDGYLELKRSLIDLKWYELKPRQRMDYLHIIRMVERPLLLHAGPFHLMNFDQMSTFVRRLYTFGLLLYKFVKG